MITPKVRVSNIDRGISVFTAVNTYQSRKLNEQILNQQYKNNKQLAAIRSQIQSNITQQQFYVDLSTWSGNGIYFVHIIDGQGNTVDIRKIVLQ